MSTESIQEILERQRLLIAAIDEVKSQLDAGERRRKCIWSLDRIKADSQRLIKRLPHWESTMTQVLDTFDCFANLKFSSSDDLRVVSISFGLLQRLLEKNEREDNPSLQDFCKQVQMLTDELDTLESGDPPRISVAEASMRDIKPEVRDMERAAVKARFEARLRASIDESFAERQAEREKYY